MRTWTPIILVAGLVCVASTGSVAASLQVLPTSLELPASRSTETLTLHNSGTSVLNAQIRVVSWTQSDGEEKTVPTTDVVASPPAATIQPGGDQIIRLVRVTKRPVVGEETYRIVVDELPDLSATKNGSINFAFKYSIPMFFNTQNNGQSNIAWIVEQKGDKTFLAAKNSGNRRVRLGGLTVKTTDGKDFVFGKGLSGYVLAGSSMRWVVPGTLMHGTNGLLSVTANSDEGPINAPLQASASEHR